MPDGRLVGHTHTQCAEPPGKLRLLNSPDKSLIIIPEVKAIQRIPSMDIYYYLTAVQIAVVVVVIVVVAHIHIRLTACIASSLPTSYSFPLIYARNQRAHKNVQSRLQAGDQHKRYPECSNQCDTCGPFDWSLVSIGFA